MSIHDTAVTEFKTIGLIAKTQHMEAQQTLLALYNYLQSKGLKLIV